jgi:hypothetical protein
VLGEGPGEWEMPRTACTDRLAKSVPLRYPEIVTLRRYVIFVNADGTVRHIPATHYDRLWDDPPGRLPEYANQRVRVAEVMVECVRRDPIGMRIHAPHFLRFDSTGTIHQDELLQQAAKYLDIANAPPADTAARFLRRRLDHQFRWQVTPLIFGNIADVVFGIGRWSIPPTRTGSRRKLAGKSRHSAKR